VDSLLNVQQKHVRRFNMMQGLKQFMAKTMHTMRTINANIRISQ